MIDYKNLFNEIMDFQLEQNKKTLPSKNEGNGWRNIYSGNEEVFLNTDFLFSGLKLVQSESTEVKYNFLTAIGSLLFYGAKFKKGPNTPVPYSQIEEVINKLTSLDEIAGKSLSLPNATKLASRMVFCPNQAVTEQDLIQGLEIAPLIDGWVEMLIKMKEDWKDSTDINLLEGNSKNHKAFIDFNKMRENLLDELIAKGRLDSRDSLARSF